MKRGTALAFVLGIAVLVLSSGGCGGGGGGGRPAGGGTPAGQGSAGGSGSEAARVSVFGRVADLSGAPVAGAAVEVALDRDGDGLFAAGESRFAVTDDSGLYRVELDVSGERRVRVTARASGYLPLQRTGRVGLDTGPFRLDLVLQAGVEARVEGQRIEAAVPVDGQGTTGTVEVSFEALDEPLPEGSTARVAYVNPAESMEAFPGELAGATRFGTEGLLMSAGVVEVEVRGPDGERLDPEGTIRMSMPLPRALWSNLADGDPDTEDRIEVPLWWYDEATGRWVEADTQGVVVDAQGTPVPRSRLFEIVTGADDPGELRVVGTVPHLSAWNLDFAAPVAGLAGQVAGAAAGSAVCAAGGLCRHVDDKGRFQLPVYQWGRPLDGAEDVARLLESLVEQMEEEPPGPEPGGADGCAEYEAVVSRSLEHMKSQAKAVLRGLLSDYRDNEELRGRLLEAYRAIDRAQGMRDVSTALTYALEKLPGRALAEKYGGDFMAYFEETSYEDALNALYGFTKGIVDLGKSLGRLSIRSCQDVAQDVLSISTDVKDIFISEMENLALKKGDLGQFLDLNDRFVSWSKDTTSKILLNGAFVDCVKQVASNIKNLPGTNKFVQFVKALKQTGSGVVLTSGEGRAMLMSVKEVLEGSKNVDGSGVLLSLFLDEALLAWKQWKEILPRALDFEYWQRIRDSLLANQRIASRFAARYRSLLERGEISQDCYDRLTGILRTGGRTQPRAGRAAADAQEETGDELAAIDQEIDALAEESPEAAEIVRRMFYGLLSAQAAQNLYVAARTLQGRVEAYDTWTDASGQHAAPPADKTGGGRTVHLYFLDSWGRPMPLGVSDTGADPERLGVPNAAAYWGNAGLRFRYVGTFQTKDPLHTFRGRAVDSTGAPVGARMAVVVNEDSWSYIEPDAGRFELSGALRAGDRVRLVWNGHTVAEYEIADGDLDAETYRDIPVRSVLGAALEVRPIGEDDPTRVSFRLRYTVFPAGSVESVLGSARLVSVSDVDTGREVLEKPVPVGLDGSGTLDLPGGGRYRFTCEVTDKHGATTTAAAVYVAPMDTVRLDPIEVLTDLGTYEYGQPIRFRVRARDEKGYPLRYRWTTARTGGVVSAVEPEGFTGAEYAVVPAVRWDPGSEAPPSLEVSVQVWSPVDQDVARVEVLLPRPTVEPTVTCDVSASADESGVIYAIRAEARPPGSSFVQVPEDTGVASVRVFLDDSLQGETACDGAPGACAVSQRVSLEPGGHRVRAVVTDTAGRETEAAVAFTVPESVEIVAEPAEDDDLTYRVRLHVVYPEHGEGELPEEATVQWSFDGLTWSDPSTDARAEHAYAAYGDYLVYARIESPDGVPIVVQKLLSVLPRVSPEVSASSGFAPLEVRFELHGDLEAAHVTGLRWDPTGLADPDDLPLSSDPVFTHTYDQAGLYAPRVFLEFEDGSRIRIPLGDAPVVVSSPVSLTLEADPAEGTAPLTVSFTAAADLGASQYEWDFDGDGTVDATTSEPSAEHTYPEPGTYQPAVTGLFGDTRYSAVATVQVAGAATVVLGDGSEPLLDEVVYRFSAQDPFAYLGRERTDAQGRIQVDPPCLLGRVHAEPGYRGYRFLYVGGGGTTEWEDTRILDSGTVFTGLDDPALSAVRVCGSNGTAYLNAEAIQGGTVSVKNASNWCYVHNGIRSAAYVLELVRRQVFRSAPIMGGPSFTYSYRFVRDVALSSAAARVDVSSLADLATGTVNIETGQDELTLGSVEAYARVQGIPRELPLPVQASSNRITLPLPAGLESVRLVTLWNHGTWGLVGAVETELEADALADLVDEGEVTLSLPLSLKALALPDEWSVSQEVDGTSYTLSLDGANTARLVYVSGAAGPVRLRVRAPAWDGTTREWTVTASPEDLPEGWSDAPVALGVDRVDARVDQDSGAVSVSYQVSGDAESCSLFLISEWHPDVSLDLEADGIPTTITDMRFVWPDQEAPWFDDEGAAGLWVQVTCCDVAGNCAVGYGP